MLCSKMATRRDGFQFPCGKCINCRVNRRRTWVARLLLEAASHEYSSFVTLTFADNGVLTILRRSDLKGFYRNLRIHYPELRHFSVGEYGTKFGRAHYHAHIFTRSKPLDERHLAEAWPYGSIDVGSTEAHSLQYVLGYLFKDSRFAWPVESRYPQFRSYSRGIGRRAFDELCTPGFLPREFTVLGQSWPIGRYHRELAKARGVLIDDTKTAKLEKLEAAHVRSLLGNPSLTHEQITEVYDDALKRRQEKSQELQRKAIRDAYRQDHGHVQKGNDNETF